MRRYKRKTVHEINLTPLLDVLFSILFIVMMLGMQNEKTIEVDHQQQISKKDQEISQMNEENSHLKEQVTNYRNQMSSYDKYEEEAVIVTVTNRMNEENHYLIVKQGINQNELENIQLGVDKTENTKMRINELISTMVQATDNQPVYVVFYCDKGNIYTTEYRAIVEAFNQLQTKYKEVFFKVMEDSE